MALRRVVAEWPGSDGGHTLVRFGLVANRISALGFVRRIGRGVELAAADAIASGAGLLRSERFAIGWRHVGFLQYWSSFEAVEAWSHAAPHSEWWRKAVDRMRSKGDFGLYHEAFVVPVGGFESIYLDCPPVGVSAFGRLSDAVGPKTTARQRIGR